MTKRQNKVFVAMNLPVGVNALIVKARAIITASTNNPYFPNPNPSMAKLGALVEAAATAQAATLTRATGTASARDTAVTALRGGLTTFSVYVQEQADATPELAAAIITSAGFDVRKASTRRKRLFTAKPGRVPGSVDVAVKALVKTASYNWEWSANGGKTWNRSPNTLQADTTITGLPIGETVLIRYRRVTKAGEGDWSEPISVVVK
jgi:hypothetical protein